MAKTIFEALDFEGRKANEIDWICRQAGCSWTPSETLLVLRTMVDEEIIERCFPHGYRRFAAEEDCEIPL